MVGPPINVHTTPMRAQLPHVSVGILDDPMPPRQLHGLVAASRRGGAQGQAAGTVGGLGLGLGLGLGAGWGLAHGLPRMAWAGVLGVRARSGSACVGDSKASEE